jgi:hypothetical protein
MQEPGVRSWGASWADADHDGDFDLYVTTLGSPCRFFRNTGGTFAEQGAAAGVDASGSQTAHVWADFDNDNDEDVYVGAFDEPNIYYDNLTGNAWFNSGKAADNLQDRSITTVDHDSDGDSDIYVVLSNGNNLLYANSGSGRPWIRLKLVGTASNRAAIGARILWKAAGRRYVQQVNGGTGYLSQNDPRVLFPLGTTVGPDTFDIRWPSGAFQRVTGLARNQQHTIVEEDQTAVPVVDAAPPAVLGLAQNTPNPFQSATTIRFALPTGGRVTLEVLDVQGRLVRRLFEGDLVDGVWDETWDGRTEEGGPAASGVYFYRLTTPDGQRTRRLILAR